MNLTLLFKKTKFPRNVKFVYSKRGLSIKPTFTNRLCGKIRGASFSLCIYIGLFTFGSAYSFSNEELVIQNKIIPIGSKYQNSIKILNNRFRVDSDVEEVTIVLFRAFGSPPAVLVRPDGSKLFLEGDLEDDSYNWFETDNYDMISLKKPMPGPWQAVGDILPESRIMVIAGITLHAQPIPKTIFSGETIKQTAFLENAGKRVDMSPFRDVITLSIEFISTNNPEFPNFGLGSRPVARFEDNGLGFDEHESDGTFTGQFDLKINEGEWQPVFTLRTPIFTREQVNENIVLQPTPIHLNHTIEANEQGDHVLDITVDEAFVATSGFIVNGTIRHPNSEVTKFSMTDPATTHRSLNIVNSDYGIYKINMNVFAQTVTGRDLVLTVPEYAFVTAAPEVIIEPPEQTTPQIDKAIIALPAQPEPEESFLMLAIVMNVVMLSIGMVILVLIVNKRNHPNNHFFLRFKNKISRIRNKKSKTDS